MRDFFVLPPKNFSMMMILFHHDGLHKVFDDICDSDCTIS